MESISIFDMLKIGVGPSSSHTLGPWRAAERWISELKAAELFDQVESIRVHVYGSLSLTGKGHATDYAVMLGLSGTDPVEIPIEDIHGIVEEIQDIHILNFGKKRKLSFDPKEDILFHRKFLEYHANGLRFEATLRSGKKKATTYYSIGGGFVVTKERKNAKRKQATFATFPYPVQNGKELLAYCNAKKLSISELVLENERSLRSDSEIDANIQKVWDTMLESMYLGCHTEGKLPGGLNVQRRAYPMNKNMLNDIKAYETPESWLKTIRNTEVKFRQILKWVSCFALAVNEVNASLGRVVTAPTNGSAGVIPAVIMYYMVIENHEADFSHIKQFLLVAGEIGSIFKKGATISAAMGGCQAEIGVSSSMAAGGLTELLGGSPEQVLMAAEIAMEHHLGLTCDPIAGLVQIPCIERNSMGAIKAINAAELALGSDPKDAKVPLDKVVKTMWATAKDMSSKYKETSEGGLAVGINMSDC
ncbi:L-serine ammonia-lyase [Pricia sp. S334]|uniref:L-serine dehydratase n=1 Tax=Pricia mediterranea TaxID=3076079 RepID=A0ABU3LAT0_9FLAO|nr:L-serine ammonia-lyase [Pricia sp. S334]MDT7830333.1 L-serine ammonia-lyase [Pricia sp. S334]